MVGVIVNLALFFADHVFWPQATSSAPAADAPATPDTGDAVVQPAESSGEGDDLADPRRAQAGLRRAQTCIGTTTDSTRADDRRWRRRGQAPPLA